MKKIWKVNGTSVKHLPFTIPIPSQSQTQSPTETGGQVNQCSAVHSRCRAVSLPSTHLPIPFPFRIPGPRPPPTTHPVPQPRMVLEPGIDPPGGPRGGGGARGGAADVTTGNGKPNPSRVSLASAIDSASPQSNPESAGEEAERPQT